MKNFSVSKNVTALFDRPVLLLSSAVGAILLLVGGWPLALRAYRLYQQWFIGFGPLGTRLGSLVLFAVGVVALVLVRRRYGRTVTPGPSGRAAAKS